MIRLFGHYISKHFLLLGMLELGVFFVALLAGYCVRFSEYDFQLLLENEQLLSVACFYAVVMSITMAALGVYQMGLQDRAGLVLRSGLAFLLTSMITSMAFYAFPEYTLGRGVFGFALLFSFVLVLMLREVFFRVVDRASFKHRLLVLGVGKQAKHLEYLETSDAGFIIVKFVRLHDKINCVPESKQVDINHSLLSIVLREEIDEIVVAVDDRREYLPVDDIIDCKMAGIKVYDLVMFYEKETARINVDLLYPGWVLFSGGFNVGIFRQYTKRAMDVLVSLVMLVGLSPFMLLICIASLVESRFRDPVFFFQVRVGLNGKPFSLYKYRSMRVDAEADGIARWATKNDSRVTTLGRIMRMARIDELPQLMNVLKGDMSMVGPRPERPEFVTRLAKEIPFYSERHRVKPGVTGWAQLRYQYGSTSNDAKHKLEYDLYYVKNVSLFLDLNILLLTVEVVLFGKGAR